MHDNEDPILTAIQEDAEKLEWLDRKDSWNRWVIVRSLGAALRKWFARIVAGMFT